MNAILKNIYEDLLELSSTDMQKQLWLGGSSNEISSFSELMSRLFDDSHFDDFVDRDAENLGLKAELVLELQNLRDLLNHYKEKDTDLEIITDPKWLAVVTQAVKVLNIWNASLNE